MGQNNFSFSEPEQGSAFSPALCNEDIQKLLTKSKKEVKAANQEVFTLLESGHKSSSALELKNRLVVLDKYLTNFSDFLDERLDRSEEAKKDELLKSFFRACNQMTNRVDKMNRLLSDDISICQHKEAKEAKDGIKIVTYIVGLPTLAANLAKIFFEDKSPAIPYIALTSFVAGLWVAFPKEAKGLWSTAKKTVSDKPRLLRHNFLFYYARNSAKEGARAATKRARKLFQVNKPFL